MKAQARKQLSFEPKFHRRVSQGKYVLIPTLKKSENNKEVIDERTSIIEEGFIIAENDLERPFKALQEVDKGNVASVIANSNPEFKKTVSDS